MPVPLAGEHPAVTFAQELLALIDRYEELLTPADIGLVMAANLPATLMVYCTPAAGVALQIHFLGETQKRMAKASLRSGVNS